jgi:hypothetical protein
MGRNRFEIACEIALEHSHVERRLPNRAMKEIAKTLEKVAGKRLLPRPDETLAVTFDNRKTAALVYDKVLRIPPDDEIPEEFGYYGGTVAELTILAGIIMESVAKDFGVNVIEIGEITPIAEKENVLSWLKSISDHQTKSLGVSPTIFYPSRASQSQELKVGPKEVLLAAFNDLNIVDEDRLSWEQVREFRLDAEARVKYRRLSRWLDLQLKEGSPQEIVDLIATRLDDYEWSLRKHGIKTVTGSLASIFDPKFLPVASASSGGAIFAFGIWGAMAAAGLALTRFGVELAKLSVEGQDERRSANYELAYVHEIKKKFS